MNEQLDLITHQNSKREALLLIGHGSQEEAAVAEYYHFAERLAGQLQLPVYPCFLEFADPPIALGIRQCVEAGFQRVIALPLFLGPAGHQKNDVPAIINWAKAQWPDLQFQYGTPLGAQPQIVSALAQRAEEAIATSSMRVPIEETALIVVGRGSRDPDSNSELYKITRLLWEGRKYGWVEAAFYSLTSPGIGQTIDRCVRLGARRIVIIPYLLFTGAICHRTGDQAYSVQPLYPEVEILVAKHLSDHAGVLEAVVHRYQEVVDGTATMTCDLCKYRHRLVGFEDEYGLPQGSDHHHGLRGVAHSHGLGGDILPAGNLESLLPPRYQNGGQVSATPMGAAALQYDAEGRVAWDRVWTSFCDLALAGGPPHRGELLEPVLPEAVAANPEGYESVLTELERGIHMVTGLPVIRSRAAGWLGIECASEAMALWLLRAIVVENISVRREGRRLFLPAGPDFRLEYEIKNVITAVAKTHHYWTEHIAAMPQSER